MLKKCLKKKQLLNVDILIIASCILGVVVSIYAIFTVGQTDIYSDSVIALKLADSIVEHRSLFPQAFSYNNGEIWTFGKQLFALLSKLFSPTLRITVGMTSMLAVLFLCITFVFMQKVIGESSVLLCIPLILLFMQNQTKFVLYEAAYTPIIAVVVLEVAMLISLIRPTKSKMDFGIKSTVFAFILAFCNVGGGKIHK